MAAALAMIAVDGAYVSYALGAREPQTGFEWLAALAALSFIASIFVAGRGITSARNAGFEGNWDLEAGRKHFSGQAGLSTIGLVLFLLCLLLSGPAESSTLEHRIIDLEAKAASMESMTVELPAGRTSLSIEVRDLGREIGSLHRELRELIESLRSWKKPDKEE
ncbi:MAG: hypothetical protein O7H41_17050 [Planctomycetota bacterium]|nr:hypothetical protein [Planctomycetota bacterium]